MIKIIKRGTRQTAICDECGCEFSYEAEDVHVTTEEEIIFGKPNIYDGSYVSCPQCAKSVIVGSRIK